MGIACCVGVTTFSFTSGPLEERKEEDRERGESCVCVSYAGACEVVLVVLVVIVVVVVVTVDLLEES